MPTDMDKRNCRRRNLATCFAASLFLSLTVLFFAPMEVILINIRDFHFSFTNVWFFQLAVSLAAAVLMTLAFSFLPGKPSLLFSALMTASGLAAWIQVLFLNGNMSILTGDEAAVPGTVKIMNAAIWLAVIAVLVLAVLRLSGKKPKAAHLILRAAAGALTAMQAVALVTLALSTDFSVHQEGYHLSGEGLFDYGSGTNVIYLVLDTADREYTEEMLSEYPELRESLSGWTWYPDAVSTYSRTYPAIPYMLSGEKCWFDKEPDDYANEAFRNSAFLRTMSERGTDIRLFSPDPQLLGEEGLKYIANAVFTGDERKHLDYLQLEKNLVKIALYKVMPYAAKDLFRYELGLVNLSSFNYRPFIQYLDPMIYGALRDNGGVAVSKDMQDTFRMIHLFSAHPGAKWDSRLNAKENPSKAEVLRGSFTFIEELVRSLKEAGIYDNTLIIVTADHGSSDGDREKLERDRAACPLLMVKYPSSDQGQPLAVNNAPVSHDDLFATVYAALSCPGGQAYGSGTALADHAEGEKRVRTHYYSAIDNKTREVELVEYEIEGDAYDFSNWHKTGKRWDIKYSANPIVDRKQDKE